MTEGAPPFGGRTEGGLAMTASGDKRRNRRCGRILQSKNMQSMCCISRTGVGNG